METLRNNYSVDAMHSMLLSAACCLPISHPLKARGSEWQGLLWGSMADTDEEARSAAREAIKALPLKLRYIQAMLEDLADFAEPQQAEAPRSVKKRGRGAAAPAVTTAARIPSEHCSQHQLSTAAAGICDQTFLPSLHAPPRLACTLCWVPCQGKNLSKKKAQVFTRFKIKWSPQELSVAHQWGCPQPNEHLICSFADNIALDAAVAALELLEWKRVADDRSTLVALLCRCLWALAGAITAASKVAAAEAAAAAAAAADSDSEGANAPALDSDVVEVPAPSPESPARCPSFSSLRE